MPPRLDKRSTSTPQLSCGIFSQFSKLQPLHWLTRLKDSVCAWPAEGLSMHYIWALQYTRYRPRQLVGLAPLLALQEGCMQHRRYCFATHTFQNPPSMQPRDMYSTWMSNRGGEKECCEECAWGQSLGLPSVVFQAIVFSCQAHNRAFSEEKKKLGPVDGLWRVSKSYCECNSAKSPWWFSAPWAWHINNRIFLAKKGKSRST